MSNRVLFLLAALGLSTALAACSQGKSAADRYLTEAVKMGDIEKTVLGTGVLQPAVVLDVGAQASGQIQSLKVDVGSIVKAGDLIAVIDPATQESTLQNAQAAQAQAQAQKASQEANTAVAQIEFDRQSQLIAKGFTTKSAYDQAVANLGVAKAQALGIDAQIRQAQTSVEKSQVDLSRTNITAPISGVVAAVLVRQGQTVNSLQVAPTIVRLAKLDVMTVQAQISEADVIGVHPGQKAFFTVLGDPDRKFYATLRAIDPAPNNADQNLIGPANAPVYYNAVFDVPNPDGVLRPGMTAEVSVVLAEADKVMTMPSAGLGPKGADGSYKVKVLGSDGKAQVRTVHIGVNDNVEAQVLDGLKVGDKVVVSDAQDTSITTGPQPKAGAKAKAGS